MTIEKFLNDLADDASRCATPRTPRKRYLRSGLVELSAVMPDGTRQPVQVNPQFIAALAYYKDRETSIEWGGGNSILLVVGTVEEIAEQLTVPAE